MKNYKGDTKAFESNWKSRKETAYLHWTRDKVANQIQLAFRRHWLTFSKILENKNLKSKRSLEVGCGRGSLSAYFADNGWDATLLDISETVISEAQSAFSCNNLVANFDVGDCMSLPYPDKSFDVVFSIGLLEHFSDISKVISEQSRVLDDGGVFLGYVVPELKDSLQNNYNWFNEILSTYVNDKDLQADKVAVYRSDDLSPKYLKVMEKCNLENCSSTGIYSLPMISPSIEFPFTLMNQKAEKILVEHFDTLLENKSKTSHDPWLCEEGKGQAFLLIGQKLL